MRLNNVSLACAGVVSLCLALAVPRAAEAQQKPVSQTTAPLTINLSAGASTATGPAHQTMTTAPLPINLSTASTATTANRLAFTTATLTIAPGSGTPAASLSSARQTMTVAPLVINLIAAGTTPGSVRSALAMTAAPLVINLVSTASQPAALSRTAMTTAPLTITLTR